MPVYSKTTWVDGTTPAISAANLNKLEQGVFDSLRQDGSTTMSAQLVTIAGTVGTPAIAPTGDSNTGIFFPAADTIAFGEGGTEVMRINSSGFVGINNQTPTANLSVKASSDQIAAQFIAYDGSTGSALQFRNNTNASETALIWAHNTDGLILKSASGAVRLRTGSTDGLVMNSSGNVGIGTASPTSKLHISSATGSYGNSIQITNTSTASSFQSVMAFYTDNSTSNQFLIGKNNVADGASTFLSNQANSSMIFETNGTSRLLIENGGRTRPAANNTYELGSSSFRWSTIYAQNALNTSDARLKTDIAESSLGLDFIAALNPVQFRYIEGGNTVERVQTGTETVEISPSIPAQPEVPEIVDEEGNVIQEYVAAVDEIPAVTEERPTYEEVITPREGIRTHFGLLAQEVKAALPDDLDFAGWALADKDDHESTQFLGYAELIAPMIKAIQELKAKVEALEAQIVK